MQILTPTGYRNIEDCAVGDEVSAFAEGNGAPIVSTIDRIIPMTAAYPGLGPTPIEYNENGAPIAWEPGEGFKWYKINDQYVVFQEQSVWRVDRGDGIVVHARMLEIGDTIFDDQDNEVVITSIEEVEGPDTFWKLEISGD